MASCSLNQIFLGEIASVQNYGAFVRIPGSKQQGLVHKSQVSSSRVDDVAEVLRRGERVWCKVINVSEDGKVGLSMKRVNQGDGRDLDPNGVEQCMDERRREAAPSGGRNKAIKLEAVLDATCSKCGTRGHLARECFVAPDGKKYDLLPEIEDEDAIGDKKKEEEEDERRHSSSKKAEKKEKLRETRRFSNGEKKDDDVARESRKSGRKKKKRSKEVESKGKRKRKKEKRERSTDDDDSDHGDKRSKKCKRSKSKRSD